MESGRCDSRRSDRGHGDRPGVAARAVFLTGLAAWAWLELADGANWFRRLIGLGGLTYVIVEIASTLES